MYPRRRMPMPSIVLDREEEMKSQTESVVASVRQDGASAERGLAASDEPTSPVGKKWFLFGFGVLYMLFLLDFAARLGITAVFPAMQKDLGLSDSQVGVAGSAVLLGMTVFVLPFSFLADKGSKKHAVNLMSAVWGVGCTLCGLVSHLFLIVLGRFMVGIGNASYAPVTALSLFLPNVKNHVSAASADGKREHVKVREAFAFTLQNKTLVLLGIGVGIANMGYTSMISWIPMFMVRIMGWTSTEVGAYMGPAYMITGLLITPFSGWLSDRLGLWSRRTRAWLGVPCFLILAAVFAAGFYYQIAACCAIGMFLFIIPVTGVHIATQELVPTRYKATAYGTYVTLLQGLGFFGPMLAGALSDAFGLQLALVYMQLVFVIGGLIMLVAGFTYVKDYNRARAMEA